MFRRQSKDKILSKIAQTTMINRSRMRDVGDTRQDYEELDSAISSGLYLKDVMNRQGEDFYYMNTLIEVTADDPETLEQRVTAVEKLCVASDMIARRCDYKQEQAFLSTLPLLSLDPDVERKSRRNALTSAWPPPFLLSPMSSATATAFFSASISTTAPRCSWTPMTITSTPTATCGLAAPPA